MDNEVHRAKIARIVLLVGICLLIPIYNLSDIRWDSGSAHGRSIVSANIALTPGYVLLFILTFIGILIRLNQPGFRFRDFSTRWLVIMICLVLWILFANVVFRTLRIEPLREIKNTIIPAIFTYVFIKCCFFNKEDIFKIVIAVAVGTCCWIVILLLYLDFNSDIVRQEIETARADYGVLGIYAAVSLFGSSCLLLYARGIWKAIFFFIIAICLLGVFFAGNRATIYTVLFSPVLMFFLRSLSYKFIKIGVIVILGFTLFFSLLPGQVVSTGEALLGTGDPVEHFGFYRIFPGIDRLWHQLRIRLIDWDAMMFDHTFFGMFTGVDYRIGLDRCHVLHHPHNVFVLMQMLGGIVATGLFVCAFLLIFFDTLIAAKKMHRGIWCSLAEYMVLGYVILFTTNISNSWFKGVSVIVGILCAISTCLKESFSTKKKHLICVPG